MLSHQWGWEASLTKEQRRTQLGTNKSPFLIRYNYVLSQRYTAPHISSPAYTYVHTHEDSGFLDKPRAGGNVVRCVEGYHCTFIFMSNEC